MPTEMYHECGKKHTVKDEEVDDETTDSTQKLLNGNTSMWLKMSKMGESHQHQQRQRATHIEQSATVPPLYLLVKDHKKQNDDEPPCVWSNSWYEQSSFKHNQYLFGGNC